MTATNGPGSRRSRRQHERVTNADRVLQNAIARFHIDGGAPRVTHLIAAEPEDVP